MYNRFYVFLQFHIYSNAILTAELRIRHVSVFHQSNTSLDGLALAGQRIYWTYYDSVTMSGGIMSKSTAGINATAQVVVTNLYQPRALVVDIDTNGQVYCAAPVLRLCLLRNTHTVHVLGPCTGLTFRPRPGPQHNCHI